MTRDTGSTSGEHESCADFLDRIVYLLDNELDATEVAIVKVHLDECAPCFERYDVQRTIKMIVARSCTESAPDALREKVKVRLQQVSIEMHHEA
jgi:mycothiol system anti-sigma-R factor